ncbi:MAG: hypothetical protein ACP5MH_12115 [Thermoproteus sp.]
MDLMDFLKAFIGVLVEHMALEVAAAVGLFILLQEVKRKTARRVA